MTIEEKATAYADENWYQFNACEWDKEYVTDGLEACYFAGATEALASQWRSVEEELPNTDDDVLVWTGSSLHIASFWESKWYSADDNFRTFPQMWMPIPSIPDTNTEKKMTDKTLESLGKTADMIFALHYALKEQKEQIGFAPLELGKAICSLAEAERYLRSAILKNERNMKHLLTPEQSATLIAKGISADKASAQGERIYKPVALQSGAIKRVFEGYEPIFTLADILSLLPKEINILEDHYCLIMKVADCSSTVYYGNQLERFSPYESSDELIDVLYKLLLWVIDKGFTYLTK